LDPIEWFKGLSPILQALIATLFTWGVTALGAGAVIFVVAEEVIPGSQRKGNTDLSTMALMAGFIVMMVLDVVLG